MGNPLQNTLLLLLLAIGCFACKKSTVISGVVMDSGTKAPLEGANILFVANKPSNTGSETEDKVNFVTTADGKFDLEVEGKDIYSVFARFTKPGYFDGYMGGFENGSTTRDIVTYLHPYDAVLKLKFFNVSGAAEFHYYITGELYGGSNESGPTGSPVKVPPNDSLVLYKKVLGGSLNKVVWHTQKFFGTGLVPFEYQYYCNRRDTTEAYIEF